MPICTGDCTSPCNCSIEEDGFWANRPQDGRRNVVVEGSGTVLDPITISFMQSEFFRPEASEIQASSKTTTSGVDTTIEADDYDIVVYSTPHQVLIKLAGISAQPMTAFHNFFVVGASATFPANATGVRQIEIGTEDDENDSIRISGNEQSAVSSASSVLTCTGFIPGFMSPASFPEGFLFTRSTPISVAVRQTSGAPMIVSQIKLWVTMI